MLFRSSTYLVLLGNTFQGFPFPNGMGREFLGIDPNTHEKEEYCCRYCFIVNLHYYGFLRLMNNRWVYLKNVSSPIIILKNKNKFFHRASIDGMVIYAFQTGHTLHCLLFPLDRCRGFGTNIVHHPIYPPYFINNVIGNLL